MKTSARPRIGCAGWSISAADSGRFGVGDSVLARYSTRFNAVEINSSFYRPHRRQTYERWASSVPSDFLFSAKVPKAITHDARLRGVGGLLDAFVNEVSGLGQNLGGLLVQLPPSLVFDRRVASTFFSMMRRRTPVALACEPRHASWFDPAAESLMLDMDVARVAADPPPVPGAAAVGGAGAWVYWRWHGSPRRYYSDYSDDTLNELADAVRQAPVASATPWIIFDNTAAGHATTNALSLQALLEKRPGERTGAQ